MAHYLVTGAAGFIGSRTSQLLVRDGHTVIGIDNMNAAYDIRMKQHRLAGLQTLPGFEFRKLDISIVQDVDTLAGENFDAIVNLAARAGVRASVENPRLFYDTNLMGTLNLLELARRRGIQKFLLASTSSIYGANPRYPTPETESSSEPLQPYAASKKAAEVLAHSYHYLHGIDVSVVRYFTVYGPAGRPDLAMFRFCQWINEGRPVLVNGTGEQSRGFTYLDDIARGTILALKPLGFEVINLGGHEVISINGLITLLEELIGRKANVQYGPPNLADMFTNWADVSKAGQLLGWEPRVGLREGAGKLVEWYAAERSWACEIATA
ncbi:MAG TPA: NAD-dependent epimerase/dehydratase family protein [Anaerolineales bacterium]|nr:NAD-dependent epimerase/dehydratase family protein [Anaerolineales bacterium]